MAEGGDTISKMMQGLTCTICLDVYTDPRQLQCNHISCYRCLLNLAPRRAAVTCPSCRQVTPLPSNGVAGLPKAFQILPFLKIVDDHKKTRSDASLCPAHPGAELEFYCEPCCKLICCRCAVRGGKHFNHDYKELKDAFESYKEEITGTTERKLEAIRKAVVNLEDYHDEITNHQEFICGEIDNAAMKLKKRVDSWQRELKAQLRQNTDKKLEELSVQIRRAKTTQTVFSKNFASLARNLEAADYRKVLTNKKKQIIFTFQPDTLKPIPGANVMLGFPKDIFFGQLFECHVTGKGLHKAVVGKKSVVSIEFKSLDGATCSGLNIPLDSELVPEKPGSCPCVYHDCHANTLSYTPTTEGWHKLHIRVGGQYICGSPFRVKVQQIM